jgi:alpha-ketoglutarate-dependent taurine dioxygenase
MSEHVIDFHDVDSVRYMLADKGIAFLKQVPADRGALVNYCSTLFEIKEQNSNDDGIAVITNKTTNKKIGQGYTSEALYPHTDRSGLQDPPRYVFLSFIQTAGVGGESIFVDGNSVVNSLMRDDPDLVDILLNEECLFHRGGQRLCSPILSDFNGRFEWRFRFDQHGFFPRKLVESFVRLDKAFKFNTVFRQMSAGEAWIIDNKRFLHGRTAFIGEREAWRVLGW